MQGQILNQVGFRMNNPAGCVLRFPLRLPWILNLMDGAIFSSQTAMLTLDTNCLVLADSSRLTGTYVEGPIRKLGLKSADYFIFPVGRSGNLRWLALTGTVGDCTVEYFRTNPSVLGTNLGSGLDHISKLEYWTATNSGQGSENAKIELSFASAQCGGVTDPQFLHVAKFQTDIWADAGHSAVTGNAIQGSVSSAPTDFNAEAYTLASTENLENPLPVSLIHLTIKEIPGGTLYNWTITGPEVPEHFDLNEESNFGSSSIARIPGDAGMSKYQWIGPVLEKGDHFFSIKMTDIHGVEYFGKTVLFVKIADQEKVSWLIPSSPQGNSRLLIEANATEKWDYEIIYMNGVVVK